MLSVHVVMNPKKTRFEIFNSWVKNNSIISVLIIFGTIVIGLSSFTNAARNLYHGSVSKDEIQFVLQSDRPWGYPIQNFIAKQK